MGCMLRCFGTMCRFVNFEVYLAFAKQTDKFVLYILSFKGYLSPVCHDQTTQEIFTEVCSLPSRRLHRMDGEFSPIVCFNFYSLLNCAHSIQSLQGQIGLPSSLKQELLPGIFSLLDMCTKFELQHVHTLLDPTGKALFKSLHQSHSQGHKFDGRV